MSVSLRGILLCAAFSLFGACARTPTVTPAVGVSNCMQVFVEDDARLAQAGIHDAQSARVAGHPYLRVDRLLASFTGTLTEPAQRAAWLERAAALDAEARSLEHARLSATRDLVRDDALAQCRRTLVEASLTNESAWPVLLAAATVPDDYSETRRALGAYALSSRVVLRGVKRMQQREMPRRLDAASAAAVTGRRYGLKDAGTVTDRTRPISPWPQDALGIPRIAEADLAQLFRRHAPELLVETASDDDIPGHVTADKPPYLVTTESTLYTHLAYTRFENHVLPQLVYTWWFAARTARGAVDPLAGALDGVSWRVTLDNDGAPLAYDVVHNCGCYHMFFPSARLQARTGVDDGAEPPWIPFSVPDAWQGRVRLLLASGTHYVTALAPAAPRTVEHRYDLLPYEALRNLATGAERVSLFDARGLVPGSARGERWLLWPMGIVAPGSMRQWGHQATAFVGRRHFDEACLFERYFERALSKSGESSAASSAAD